MNDSLPLRDIHLPDPIGWWPPAMGWWLLIILLPLLGYVLWRLFKRLTRKTAVKTARKLLRELRQNPELDELQKLQQLSALMRRVAISTASRKEAAALTGKQWLAYLDRAFPDAPFSQGIGHYLAQAQYQKQLPKDLDLDALFNLCEQWIKKQR